MAWYPKLGGYDRSSEAKDGATDTFYLVELLPGVAESNRLFVGNLSWTLPAHGHSETSDAALAGLGPCGSDTHHPDFLWTPLI